MILTPRLRLRALTTRDLALFRKLYCDAQTMRHIGKPMATAQAAASLRATVAATRKPGALRFFVIAERYSRRGVGLCSLRSTARDKRGAEAGLMLLPAACGRGYAREALSALIEVAFFQLHASTIWVQYRKANHAATRLVDALGFSPPNETELRRRIRSLSRKVWRKRADPSPRGEKCRTSSDFWNKPAPTPRCGMPAAKPCWN